VCWAFAVLRVHCTAEDLLGVRFAAAPAPLLELGLALAMAQRQDSPLFAAWRARTRRGLPKAARLLYQLVKPDGTGPVFLDPISTGLDDGLEQVLRSPRRLVRSELGRIFPRVRPPWAALASGDREYWSALVGALRAAHRAVLADDWGRVLASHRAELGHRGRLVAEVGLKEAMASAFPGARWAGETLHIPSVRSRDLILAGRGVTMTPSAFWQAHPLIAPRADGRLALIYPALTPVPLIGVEPAADRLAALLGSTRAAVLRTLVEERTTTQLAAAVGVSLAAASEHAKTLRASGLITTQRVGKAVVHSCTALGLRIQAGG
jgi:DNA-binding transcriptional ArsR family regulator